jgi:hypothetical protein
VLSRTPLNTFASRATRSTGPLHEFAAMVDARFLHTRSHEREAIFEALAKDHLRHGFCSATPEHQRPVGCGSQEG